MSERVEIPDSLLRDVWRIASEKGVSVATLVEDVLRQAVADEAFYARRLRTVDWDAFDRFMSRDGGEPPQPGDELPEGMTWETLSPPRP